MPISRRMVLAGAAVFPAFALPPHSANAQPGLGLAERRAVAAYQEGVFPGLLAKIRAAAGTDVEVDVGWDRIAQPGQAAQYAGPGYWTDIYFTPLTRALTAIGSDAMGRDALKAKLRRIAVAYNPDTAPASNYPNGLRFADGTLTINWHPNSNASDVADRAEALQKVLEAGL